MPKRKGYESFMKRYEDKIKSVTLVSTTPIDCSEEIIRKIEESLTNGGYKDVCSGRVDTPGIAAIWNSGKYNDGDGIFCVSVDISLEEKDKGIVYVRALKNQIENVKGALRVALPKTEFKPLPEHV